MTSPQPPAALRPFRFSVQGSGIVDPTEWTELARKAEDLGYSTLSIADHVDTQLAPLVALTAAAAVTSELRLLTLVLANDFRHPVVLAKEAASLDQLSGGRLELGLGAGWATADYEGMGIDYDRPGVRIARLAEAAPIIKGLLSGARVDVDGEHYNVHLSGSPAARQQPHPPILIAGGGKKVLSLGAREADMVGVNPGLGAGVIDHRAGPSATSTATDDKIGWIRDAAGERFDQIELQTRVHLAAISDNREEVAALMADGLGMDAADALETPHALVGSIAQCVEQLHQWRERWGITYIGLSYDALESMAPVVAAAND